MSHIARVIESAHDLGFYRMVVDDDTDKILETTLVVYEAVVRSHHLPNVRCDRLFSCQKMIETGAIATQQNTTNT